MESRSSERESIYGSQLVVSHMLKLCHIAYDGTTRTQSVSKYSRLKPSNETGGTFILGLEVSPSSNIIETFLLEIGVVFLIPANVSFDPPPRLRSKFSTLHDVTERANKNDSHFNRSLHLKEMYCF